MATTSEQQVTLDEALVPSAQRLRIGRSNFRLPSDIQSKESTLQVVYDVLRRSPFFKAFSVTAYVPEIYMQEFWATAKVHQHSIRFKMDTKKHIVDLDAFREMLHISLRVPGQSFAELPFEEEILEFLRFLGHSAQIKTLTDVNVNKLFQPWRSFAAVINKCLTGKSTGFDSLRLSQAQILWGLYHKRNVDYAFLIWEDLMYQVEHKNQKKSNEMYYPRFTKVIIHHFMTKKPSIHRRKKTSGTKASGRRKRGGSALSTTPPTPIATPTPLAAPWLTAAAKGKQPARATSHTEPSDVKRTEAEQLKIILRRSRHETRISQQGGSSTDEGTGSIPGVLDVPSDDSEEEISWNSSDNEDVDDQNKGSDDKEGEKTNESDDDDDDQDEPEEVNADNDDEEEISKIDEQEAIESGGDDEEDEESDGENKKEETTEKEEESFDPILRTSKESEDDGNGEEDQGLRISEEERMHEEKEADELYRDVDINQRRGLQVSQDIEDSHVTLTPTHSDGQQESSSTSSFVTNLLNPIFDPGMESICKTGSSFITPIPSPKSTMTPSIITTTTTTSQPPIPPTPIPSDVLQTLPTFASVFRYEDRVKSLEVNFSEFMRTNQSTETVSNILGLVHQYMHQEMTEATDRLQDSIQRENDEFLITIDDNIKKIIKEKVKSQVKVQVTRILPRIEVSVNAQLKAEVLTRSSHSSRTSYAVAADLSEMELKKILIDKMEGNKRKEDDDQEGPSAGSDWGSKRRREGGEHASASTSFEPATGSAGRSTTGTQSRQMSASESAFAEEPVQTTCQMEEPSHPVFEIGAEDQPIVQTSQHPEWFSQPRKPPTPNRDWNKSFPADQGNAQSWIS
nr:hypothetical protein [Tanacetum cinerariifolium]